MCNLISLPSISIGRVLKPIPIEDASCSALDFTVTAPTVGVVVDDRLPTVELEM